MAPLEADLAAIKGLFSELESSPGRMLAADLLFVLGELGLSFTAAGVARILGAPALADEVDYGAFLDACFDVDGAAPAVDSGSLAGAEARHILCTGGAGFIGSHTVVKLLEGGFRVSVMDNYCNSSPRVRERLREITGQEVPFFEVDMLDGPAVERLFLEGRFDGVVHFAGLKAVGESVAEPLRYYQNNLVGTMNVLKAMDKSGCRALVFSSSATVYEPCEEPIDEEKPTGCSNPYGWTKWMLEQFLQDAAKADPSLAISLLRYFNPVGAHPSGRIGESPSGVPNNLLPYMLQVCTGRRAELSVFGADYPTPDGTGVRDYLHVDDLAEGHIAALRLLFERGRGVCVHNLGSGRGVSVLEMMSALERASGKSIAHKICPRRAGDLASVVANADKANRELKWEATRSLDDIMTSAWKWQSQNPNGYDNPPG